MNLKKQLYYQIDLNNIKLDKKKNVRNFREIRYYNVRNMID